ncbi:MAG: hypothetical protein B6D35_00200 [Candidatus Brocadia sp. UTAMX2]|jgi:hypothetical protein|nr:MAG: hypothetical protein B6D35_00200 [Candidatus Brocadia sp. UTAMX2]
MPIYGKCFAPTPCGNIVIMVIFQKTKVLQNNEDVFMQLKVVGVGPQKTGTTWLDRCLREHPQLCFPQGTKETFFFDERFDKGWSWYWTHFRYCMNSQFCAEIGPTYFDVPEAAARLYRHNQNCRIIITLRDPASRSFSLYLHYKLYGELRCEFHEAIMHMPRIIESSRYRMHLGRWLEIFGKEHVLIILQDDIAAFPGQVLKQVYNFIGIDDVPLPVLAEEHVNIASYTVFPSLSRFCNSMANFLRGRRLHSPVNFFKNLGLKRIYTSTSGVLPKLEPDIRRNLIEEFEPDIAYVEKLLGRPLTGWRRVK